jgi:hypothetical protein
VRPRGTARRLRSRPPLRGTEPTRPVSACPAPVRRCREG